MCTCVSGCVNARVGVYMCEWVHESESGVYMCLHMYAYLNYNRMMENQSSTIYGLV